MKSAQKYLNTSNINFLKTFIAFKCKFKWKNLNKKNAQKCLSISNKNF